MQSIFPSNKLYKNIHVKVLLRNYLEKDLQAVLLPLNLMQYFCFSSRCVIQDNFITPKNVKSIIISIIGTVTFGIIFMFKLVPLYLSSDHSLNILFLRISQFDVLFYISGLIMNIILTIYQSPNFVAMILKICDVHYVLNDKKELNKVRIMNWVMFGLLAYTYGTDVIYYLIRKMNAVYIMCVMILWCFDANVLYARGIVSLIGNKLNLWTREIKKYTEMDGNDNDDRKDRLKVINSYFDIVDAFNLFKKVFQVMMLFHTVETFIHDLIYVEMMIQVSKRYIENNGFKFTDSASVSSLTAWMVKNFTLQVIVSIQCDIYYYAVCNAQSACVLFMKSKRCSTEEMRACKNIIRAHAAEYSPLCACALYRVDARLPLRLLGLIATYTVVLLQFAFIP